MAPKNDSAKLYVRSYERRAARSTRQCWTLTGRDGLDTLAHDGHGAGPPARTTAFTLRHTCNTPLARWNLLQPPTWGCRRERQIQDLESKYRNRLRLENGTYSISLDQFGPLVQLHMSVSAQRPP